jgi:hypothetical protein
MMQTRPGGGFTRRTFLRAAGVTVPGFLAACSAPLSQSSGGALDFTITAYQGEDVLGGQIVKFSRVFENGKPVVLNFWAGQMRDKVQRLIATA